MKRYGKPGGDRFPYFFESYSGPNSIVYARNLEEALTTYQRYRSIPPWSVREMSDNE